VKRTTEALKNFQSSALRTPERRDCTLIPAVNCWATFSRPLARTVRSNTDSIVVSKKDNLSAEEANPCALQEQLHECWTVKSSTGA
jgi:hypothetical protein